MDWLHALLCSSLISPKRSGLNTFTSADWMHRWIKQVRFCYSIKTDGLLRITSTPSINMLFSILHACSVTFAELWYSWLFMYFLWVSQIASGKPGASLMRRKGEMLAMQRWPRYYNGRNYDVAHYHHVLSVSLRSTLDIWPECKTTFRISSTDICSKEKLQYYGSEKRFMWHKLCILCVRRGEPSFWRLGVVTAYMSCWRVEPLEYTPDMMWMGIRLQIRRKYRRAFNYATCASWVLVHLPSHPHTSPLPLPHTFSRTTGNVVLIACIKIFVCIWGIIHWFQRYFSDERRRMWRENGRGGGGISETYKVLVVNQDLKQWSTIVQIHLSNPCLHRNLKKKNHFFKNFNIYA